MLSLVTITATTCYILPLTFGRMSVVMASIYKRVKEDEDGDGTETASHTRSSSSSS